MNDLAAALSIVRDRIAKWRGQLVVEENTKTVLIEPILRALGWDVENLDEVRKEYRYKSGADPVDYALLQGGTPCLFVEAKALGENLDRWGNQVMGYTGVAGVGWAVLTDGNEYRIYNAAASGDDLDKKLFRRVAVASDVAAVGQTLSLLSKDQMQEKRIEMLWRTEKVDRQVKRAVEGLFTPDVPADFLHLVRKRVSDLAVADVMASLRRARFTFDYQVVQPASLPSLSPKVAAQPASGAHPGPEQGPEAETHADKTPWRHVTLRDLITSGTVHLPLDVETVYKGRQLTARIEADTSVTWNGTRYDSLSLAGAMARKSIVGAPPGRELPPDERVDFLALP
jgi:hypothetical protein